MKNKVFLITGGTGSIGKRLTNYILKNLSPKKIKIFSRDEQKQFNMSIDHNLDSKKIDYIIGDIRDINRLSDSMNNVDYVIHTAALKHVHFGEKNPEEFIETNILGTKNLIKSSLENNIDKVLFISTDKSVYPLNLYGATKLVAEKLILNQNYHDRKTKFSVVRYGNVAGSKGSVIPTFLNTIKKNSSHIVLRDKNITRFWITFEDAIICIINALKNMSGGEVFIPKMKSFYIKDLAECITDKRNIKITNLQPGEKLHENLSTNEDSSLILKYDNYFKIFLDKNKLLQELKKNNNNARMLDNNFCYSSDKNKNFLNKNDLNSLLKSLDIEK